MSGPSVDHVGLATTFTGISRKFTTPGAPNVWQFRGIKYGNIPARFTQATLNETFPKTVDSTAYGPKCPQPPTAARLEDVLIGTPPKVQPKNQPDVFDEFNCLHLNVTMPPLNLDLDFALPVMVYIHGGGGLSGSNSDWWCDGAALVSKSVAIGKPVVHVAINYRLSALGFIGSSELRQELGQTNGGNFGFHDMNLALIWISKHIGGFGGSNDQVTLYGESFGSVAVQTLMQSNLTPLFSRCILQSQILDTPLLTTPESISTKSGVFKAIKTHLNVKTVKELQAIPVQDLMSALTASDPRAGLTQVPMIDDILLSENWRKKINFARGRSGSVMIGNTGAEGSVVSVVLAGIPKPTSPPLTSALISSLHGVLSDDKVTALQEGYQIRDAPANITLYELKQNILHLIEDIAFYRPPYALVSALRAKKPSAANIYRYGFKKTNPFIGPFQNVSAHALDLAYLHGDGAIFSGTEDEAAEMAFQDRVKETWINFADGERVWDENMWLDMGLSKNLNGVTGFGFDVKTDVQFENGNGRTSLAYPALGRLSQGEQTDVLGVLMAHLGGMGGVDAAHMNGEA